MIEAAYQLIKDAIDQEGGATTSNYAMLEIIREQVENVMVSLQVQDYLSVSKEKKRRRDKIK